MNLQSIKRPIRRLMTTCGTPWIAARVENRLRRGPVAGDLDSMARNTLGFLDAIRVPESGVQFRYSASSSRATLYASCYALMTYFLLGELRTMPQRRLDDWTEYFNSFQNTETGLFHDPAVENEIFADSDWWGARHLALHMVSAFTSLGARPAHPFRFLKPWLRTDALEAVLSEQDWSKPFPDTDDFDNKLMNLAGLMQFQRDAWDDRDAGAAVAFIQDFLLSKINPATGLWGGYDPQDPAQRSRMVQFGYHLLPIFFYDGIFAFDAAKIIDHALRTQNRFGGFGVKPNSSACEDIDSIHLLVSLAGYAPERSEEIEAALRRALRWMLINQMKDGGFVFRLESAMTYGHPHLRARANEGAVFPTWFRVLACALIDGHLGGGRFVTQWAPGYEAVAA